MEQHKRHWLLATYLFITESKITMCLFYAYITFMYIFLGWVSNSPTQTIDFAIVLQMLLSTMLIGFAQGIIVPSEKMTVLRSALWCGFSTIVLVSVSAVFGWFSAMPLWCSVVFYTLLFLGLWFMVLHFYVTSKKETQALNDKLKAFQQRKNGE